MINTVGGWLECEYYTTNTCYTGGRNFWPHNLIWVLINSVHHVPPQSRRGKVWMIFCAHKLNIYNANCLRTPMKFRLISLSLLSFFYLHETDARVLSINPQVYHRSQSSNLLFSTALDNWHPVRFNGTPFAPERPRDARGVGKSVFALEMRCCSTFLPARIATYWNLSASEWLWQRERESTKLCNRIPMPLFSPCKVNRREPEDM